ncbi:MAG: hypothetical protein ACRD5J_11415, partial [Nitrososphaeraceae archaeon]
MIFILPTQATETKMSLVLDSVGIDSLNIVTIGVAISAFIFSAFTYRQNRKSEQIRIAREQMDRV